MTKTTCERCGIEMDTEYVYVDRFCAVVAPQQLCNVCMSLEYAGSMAPSPLPNKVVFVKGAPSEGLPF